MTECIANAVFLRSRAGKEEELAGRLEEISNTLASIRRLRDVHIIPFILKSDCLCCENLKPYRLAHRHVLNIAACR
jgi:hypothetical protein